MEILNYSIYQLTTSCKASEILLGSLLPYKKVILTLHYPGNLTTQLAYDKNNVSGRLSFQPAKLSITASSNVY